MATIILFFPKMQEKQVSEKTLKKKKNKTFKNSKKINIYIRKIFLGAYGLQSCKACAHHCFYSSGIKYLNVNVLKMFV